MVLALLPFIALAAVAAPNAKRPVQIAKSSAKGWKQPSWWLRGNPYRGALVADAAPGGQILFSHHATDKAYPASLTKLMTFLLVLEDLRDGRYKLSDTMVGTVTAAREIPSKIDIRPGETATVHDLLVAIMVKSANDAAVVLAQNSEAKRAGRNEIISDDLPNFIARMNRRAAELGMKHTRYVSPNGLPPPAGSNRGFDESTADDILILARTVLSMPSALSYTSLPFAKIHIGERVVPLYSHNNILCGNSIAKITAKDGRNLVDGLKTGYIDAGGSSIVLTAKSSGRRVLVVLLGCSSVPERDAMARRLMLEALSAVSPW